MGTSVRLFIRVSPDLSAREVLAQYMSRLSAVRGYKWVDASDAHITLRFLGDVDAALVSRLDTELGRVGGVRPFDIETGPVGTFPPNSSTPNVLTLSIDRGSAELQKLAASVSRAARAIGAEEERRPYRAHLTLGRSRERGQFLAPEISDLLADAPKIAWRCGSFALTKSELSPKGPIYTDIMEYML